jgi:hypothetical protein
MEKERIMVMNNEYGFTDESALDEKKKKIDEIIKPIEKYIESIWQSDRIVAEQLTLITAKLRTLLLL